VKSVSTEFVIQIGKEGLLIAFMACIPVLAAGMLVGILISIFQAVTQIQDQSISFVPKLIVSIVALIFSGPWMIDKLLTFTIKILGNLKDFVR
jgi:flagellar biosynthesis protein FliQ